MGSGIVCQLRLAGICSPNSWDAGPMCGITATVSLSLGRIVCATYFLSLGSKHFNMSLKRKEKGW